MYVDDAVVTTSACGTQANPCKTVASAWSEALTSPDPFARLVINLVDGEYTENTAISVSKNLAIQGDNSADVVLWQAGSDFILFSVETADTHFTLNSLSALFGSTDDDQGFIRSAPVAAADVSIALLACRITMLRDFNTISGQAIFISNGQASLLLKDCAVYNITSATPTGPGTGRPFIYAEVIGSFTVESTSFIKIQNTPSAAGGSCFGLGTAAAVSLKGTVFVLCESGGSGGVGAIDSVSVAAPGAGSVQSCLFWNNTAHTLGGVLAVGAGSGFTDLDPFKFDNLSFVECAVINGDGGALYFGDGMVVLLTGCSFSTCTSGGGGSGGAVWWGGTVATSVLKIDVCTFMHCAADSGDGDAVSALGDFVQVTDSYSNTGNSLFCSGSCTSNFLNLLEYESLPCSALSNGRFPMPCAGNPLTGACVKAHECPPDFLAINGLCVAGCRFWAIEEADPLLPLPFFDEAVCSPRCVPDNSRGHPLCMQAPPGSGVVYVSSSATVPAEDGVDDEDCGASPRQSVFGHPCRSLTHAAYQGQSPREVHVASGSYREGVVRNVISVIDTMKIVGASNTNCFITSAFFELSQMRNTHLTFSNLALLLSDSSYGYYFVSANASTTTSTRHTVVFHACRITMEASTTTQLSRPSVFANGTRVVVGFYGCTVYNVSTGGNHPMIHATHINLLWMKDTSFANVRCPGGLGGCFSVYTVVELSFARCQFIGCYCHYMGGVGYVEDELFGSESVLESCSFWNNSCSYSGGGVLSLYSKAGSRPVVEFINISFVECMSEGTVNGGGAISVAAFVKPTFLRCTFLRCRHGSYGGALYCYASCVMDLANCSFVECAANNGAVYMSRECNITIANCVFLRNTAGNTGINLFITNQCKLDGITTSYSDKLSQSLIVCNDSSVCGTYGFLPLDSSVDLGTLDATGSCVMPWAADTTACVFPDSDSCTGEYHRARLGLCEPECHFQVPIPAVEGSGETYEGTRCADPCSLDTSLGIELCVLCARFDRNRTECEKRSGCVYNGSTDICSDFSKCADVLAAPDDCRGAGDTQGLVAECVWGTTCEGCSDAGTLQTCRDKGAGCLWQWGRCSTRCRWPYSHHILDGECTTAPITFYVAAGLGDDTIDAECGRAVGSAACATIGFAWRQNAFSKRIMLAAGEYSEYDEIVVVGSTLNVVGGSQTGCLLSVPFSVESTNAQLVLANLTVLFNQDVYVHSVAGNAIVSIAFVSCRITLSAWESYVSSDSVSVANNLASLTFDGCSMFNITFEYAPVNLGPIKTFLMKDSSFTNIHNRNLSYYSSPYCFSVNVVANLTLVQCLCTDIDGASFLSMRPSTSDSVVKDCLFWNMTSGAVRAFSISADNSALTILNTSCVDCYSHGAVEFTDYLKPTLRGCSFTNCRKGGGLVSPEGRGGAVYCGTYVVLVVDRCSTVNCVATVQGGGIYLRDHSSVSIIDTLFLGNNCSSGADIGIDFFSELKPVTDSFTDSAASVFCTDDSTCPVVGLAPYTDTVTCSNAFSSSASTVVGGRCPVPCAASVSSCIMPHKCPSGHTAVSGVCRPSCWVWEPDVTETTDAAVEVGLGLTLDVPESFLCTGVAFLHGVVYVAVHPSAADKPRCGRVPAASANLAAFEYPCSTVAYACGQGTYIGQELARGLRKVLVEAGTYEEAQGIVVQNILNVTGTSKLTVFLTKPNNAATTYALFTIHNDTEGQLTLVELTLLLSNHSESNVFIHSYSSPVTLVSCRITMAAGVSSIYGRSVLLTLGAVLGLDGCNAYNITTADYPFVYAPSVVVYTNQSIPSLWARDSSFANVNRLYTTGKGGCFGFFNVSRIAFTRCVFAMCSSAAEQFNYGGILYVERLIETATIEACVFWNTSAYKGGVLDLSSFVQTNSATLDVSNTSYVDCTAISDSGGALRVEKSVQATLTACSFVRCQATGWGNGGGVYFKNTCEVRVGGCSFQDCTASSSGNAVYLESQCNLSLADSLFFGSATSGGGIFLAQSSQLLSATNSYTNSSSYSVVGGGEGTPSLLTKEQLDAATCGNAFSYPADILNNAKCESPCTADSASTQCVMPVACGTDYLGMNGVCLPSCAFWIPTSTADTGCTSLCSPDFSLEYPLCTPKGNGHWFTSPYPTQPPLLHPTTPPLSTVFVSSASGSDIANCGTAVGLSACKTVVYGSLRKEKEGVGEVILSVGMYVETENLDVNGSLTITGQDKSGCLLTQPRHAFSVLFLVESEAASLTIHNVTIQATDTVGTMGNLVRCSGVNFTVYVTFTACVITMQAGLTQAHGIFIYINNRYALLSLDSCTVYSINFPAPLVSNAFIYCPWLNSLSILSSSFANIRETGCFHVNNMYYNDFTLRDSTFVACHNEENGGVGSVPFVTYSGSSVTLCQFWQCSTAQNGGALYLRRSDTWNMCSNTLDISFVNNSCTYCTAEQYCGGFYIASCLKPSLQDCSFTLCAANGPINTNKQGGGALYFNGNTSATIRRCTFVDCTAVGGGGAIYHSNRSPVEIRECVFIRNMAADGKDFYPYGDVISYNSFTTDTTTAVSDLYTNYADASCATPFGAGAVIDGECKMPCAGSPEATGTTGSCLKPDACPADYVAVNGRCVPLCTFRLPETAGNPCSLLCVVDDTSLGYPVCVEGDGSTYVNPCETVSEGTYAECCTASESPPAGCTSYCAIVPKPAGCPEDADNCTEISETNYATCCAVTSPPSECAIYCADTPKPASCPPDGCTEISETNYATCCSITAPASSCVGYCAGESRPAACPSVADGAVHVSSREGADAEQCGVFEGDSACKTVAYACNKEMEEGEAVRRVLVEIGTYVETVGVNVKAITLNITGDNLSKTTLSKSNSTVFILFVVSLPHTSFKLENLSLVLTHHGPANGLIHVGGGSVAGTVVSVVNCLVTSDTSTTAIAGQCFTVANEFAAILFETCVFSQINCSRGAIIYTPDAFGSVHNLTLINCSFANILLTDGNSGSCFFLSHCTSLRLDNTTFLVCECSTSAGDTTVGGGVGYVGTLGEEGGGEGGGSGSSTIDSCIFQNITCTAYWGVLVVQTSSMVVNMLTVQATSFRFCSQSGCGALAINTLDITLSLTSCTFYSCRSSTVGGGALYVGQQGSGSAGRGQGRAGYTLTRGRHEQLAAGSGLSTISECSFVFCFCQGQGGGIYVAEEAGNTFSVDKCIFVSNSIGVEDATGIDIYIYSTTTSITVTESYSDQGSKSIGTEDEALSVVVDGTAHTGGSVEMPVFSETCVQTIPDCPLPCAYDAILGECVAPADCTPIVGKKCLDKGLDVFGSSCNQFIPDNACLASASGGGCVVEEEGSTCSVGCADEERYRPNTERVCVKRCEADSGALCKEDLKCVWVSKTGSPTIQECVYANSDISCGQYLDGGDCLTLGGISNHSCTWESDRNSEGVALSTKHCRNAVCGDYNNKREECNAKKKDMNGMDCLFISSDTAGAMGLCFDPVSDTATVEAIPCNTIVRLEECAYVSQCSVVGSTCVPVQTPGNPAEDGLKPGIIALIVIFSVVFVAAAGVGITFLVLYLKKAGPFKANRVGLEGNNESLENDEIDKVEKGVEMTAVDV